MKKPSRPSGTNQPAPLADVPSLARVTDDDLYWETKVADALGIARDRVAQIRHTRLIHGMHYQTNRGAVVLTAKGLARLNEILAERDNTATADAEPATGEITVRPGAPARNNFEVIRVPANPHLLYCVPAGERPGAPQVLIRVKDNTNFMRGMTFTAIECENDSWQFRGRLPRNKGKW